MRPDQPVHGTTGSEGGTITHLGVGRDAHSRRHAHERPEPRGRADHRVLVDVRAVTDRGTGGDGDGGTDARAVTEGEGWTGQDPFGRRMANGAVPHGGTGRDTNVDPDTHVLAYVAVRIERAMRTDDRPRIDDRTGADNGGRPHAHARHDDGAVLEPDAVRQGRLGAYDTKRAYLDADADDRVSTDVDTRSQAGGDAHQGALADDDVGRDPGIVCNESGGVNTREHRASGRGLAARARAAAAETTGTCIRKTLTDKEKAARLLEELGV